MSQGANSSRYPGSLRWMVLAFVLTAAWLPAQAQTAEDAIRFTERSPATGARMMGMAGAGIAGVADYGAFLTNPAGLGYFQQSVISGALNSVFTTNQGSSATPDFSSIDDDVSATNLGNLAYIYRFPTRRGSFVIGAGFNQVNSYERDLSFEGENSASTISTSFLPFDGEYALTNNNGLDELADLPFAAFQGGIIEFYPEFLDEDPNAYPFLEAVVPGTTIEQRGFVEERGRLNELNIGGAAEASRGVMIGLSANIAFGTYEYFSSFEEVDVFDQNTAADYSVILDEGEELQGFDALTYQQRLETDLVGISLRGGISAAVSRNVRLGATLETPTYYSVDEDFGAEYTTFFDDGGVLTYGDHVDDVGNGQFEYEIITPWRVGLGAGYDASTFSLMLDLELVDWSQLQFDASTDQSFFDDLNRTIEEDYNPVLNSRLGVEFRAGDFTLRGGLAYKPDPLDADLRTSSGDELVRDKTFFSLGLSYRFQEQAQIDLGWMQGRFDSAYAPYPEDSVGPRQDAVLLVDEEVAQNQFAIGVSFFF